MRFPCFEVSVFSYQLLYSFVCVTPKLVVCLISCLIGTLHPTFEKRGGEGLVCWYDKCTVYVVEKYSKYCQYVLSLLVTFFAFLEDFVFFV